MTIIRGAGDRSAATLPVEPSLDHLVYATTDLDAAVSRFEAVTSIRPAKGGAHLGRGTRNYLVGLGERRYLEIIGPDPGHPAPAGVALPFGIDALTGPLLLTWAVRPAHIQDAADVCAANGADLGQPLPMSRKTPSGQELTWRIASSVPLPFAGVTPFLIDWDGGTHPADSPELPVARLISMEALGVVLPVSAGPAGLFAVLETPNGPVSLS
jgi:hypothetical protein